MTKKISIERKVIEWEYRALFGKTKVTWVLPPLEMEVKNPNISKGASRRMEARQETK